MSKSVPIIAILIILAVGGMVFASNSSKTKPTNPQANQPANTSGLIMDESENNQTFSGEKGEEVKLENNQVIIPVADFETNKIRFFNTTLTNSKTVYFIVLKDDKGNFRAAANGHQKCAQYNKGHTQDGDKILCSICKDSISVNDFALDDKKECSPKSINSNLTPQNNQIIISSSDLEKVSNLF